MGMSESQGYGGLPPGAQATSQAYTRAPPLPIAQAKISSLPSASSFFILPLNVRYSAGSWSPTLPPEMLYFSSLTRIAVPAVLIHLVTGFQGLGPIRERSCVQARCSVLPCCFLVEPAPHLPSGSIALCSSRGLGPELHLV